MGIIVIVLFDSPIAATMVNFMVQVTFIIVLWLYRKDFTFFFSIVSVELLILLAIALQNMVAVLDYFKKYDDFNQRTWLIKVCSLCLIAPIVIYFVQLVLEWKNILKEYKKKVKFYFKSHCKFKPNLKKYKDQRKGFVYETDTNNNTNNINNINNISNINKSSNIMLTNIISITTNTRNN